MKPDVIQAWCALASTVAAIASFVVAAMAVCYARRSERGAKKQAEQFADFLEALVIANVLGQDNINSIEMFKSHYRGKTEIFRKPSKS